MGHRFLKSATALITAMALGFAPVARAEDFDLSATVAIKTEPRGPEGKSNLNFTVSEVEPGQEVQVVEDAVKKNPNATLTIIGTGPIEAIHPQLLYLQHRVVAFERLQYKEPLEPIVSTPPSVQTKKPSKAKALFVTVRAAGSFAAAYYLLGRDYAGVPEMLMNADFLGAVKPLLSGDPAATAKAFGLAMIFSGYQIMFTSSWQKYLRSAGSVGRKAWETVAKAVGQSVQNGQLSDKFGRMLGAYGFNLLTTTTILATLGGVEALTDMQTLAGAVHVGTLAAVASWDAVLDVFLGRQVEVGRMSQRRYEKFVEYRLTYGPWLEGPAIALSGTVVGAASASLLAVVGTIGVVMTLGFEPLQDLLARRRGIASDQPKPQRTLWQKIKAKFESKKESSSRTCETVLMDAG